MKNDTKVKVIRKGSEHHIEIRGIGTEDFIYKKNGKVVNATFEEITPGNFTITEHE